MSDTKKQINKLVSTKMAKRGERLEEQRGDLEETGNILTDYRLYFDGAREALAAAGVEKDAYKSVELAYQTNETELKLLEQRMNLQQALEDESEEE